MKRSGIWAACVVLVLLVGVGVLAVGAGYAGDKDAEDEDAVAKCSKATLHGQYLFDGHGVQIKEDNQVPIAAAGYEVFDGNGKVNGVGSFYSDGQITRKDPFSGTYTVKANCTGTSTYADGTRLDLFIAPDGSMFTSIRTDAPELVVSGFELQGTAKRVGD
jgi:hypothetical protein